MSNQKEKPTKQASKIKIVERKNEDIKKKIKEIKTTKSIKIKKNKICPKINDVLKPSESSEPPEPFGSSTSSQPLEPSPPSEPSQPSEPPQPSESSQPSELSEFSEKNNNIDNINNTNSIIVEDKKKSQFKGNIIKSIKIVHSRLPLASIITGEKYICVCYSDHSHTLNILLLGEDFKHIETIRDTHFTDFPGSIEGDIYESKLFLCFGNEVLIFTIPKLELLQRLKFCAKCRDLHIYNSKMYISFGSYIGVVTLQGEALHVISLPHNYCYVYKFVIGDDKIFFVDDYSNNIIKYTTDGKFLSEIKICMNPYGIKPITYIFYNNGHIYMFLDFSPKDYPKVIQFTENGELIKTWTLKMDLEFGPRDINFLNGRFILGNNYSNFVVYE